MPSTERKRILCLSNVFDEEYARLRGEAIDTCLSTPKRRDLFKCLEFATGREVIVLSFPPKASHRRSGRWLSPVETRFSTHRQFVCRNLDLPKLRVPFAWFFYAVQLVRRARSGDIIVLDNYEFISALAAWATRIFRRVSFVLEYEDGKHLIHRSWTKVVGELAQRMAQPLIRAALLAHPGLKQCLPPAVPSELVPGFVHHVSRNPDRSSDEVGFLYSGSLDQTRGVDLLIESLPLLPPEGWRLEITGTGPLADRVSQAASDSRWKGRVRFHGVLDKIELQKVIGAAQVGLNCQRTSDPISQVTFPSKVFSYFSAGLTVLSSKASEMQRICGPACLYYSEETPQALATAMAEVIRDFAQNGVPPFPKERLASYSIEGTSLRIRQLLLQARLIEFTEGNEPSEKRESQLPSPNMGTPAKA